MTEDISKTIGRNLRRIRRAADLSQEQLGRLVGVHQQAIGRYENGGCEMGVGRLMQIATALQRPPESFFLQDQFDGAGRNRRLDHPPIRP